MTDTAATSYASKSDLSNKITVEDTATKIEGLIIQGTDDKIWGFVLYSQPEGVTTITDMYTFEAGRGKNLFRLIGFVLKQDFNWTGSLKEDANNAKMIQWFKPAAENPMECGYTIRA